MPFFRDLFYGLRLLRRNPAFYLLGVLIISLGIGATTAIFSLIDGVLLNPLPYRDSARLAVIWSDFSRQGGNSRALTAPALFFDWRDRSRSFESMAAFVYTNATFTAMDQPITSPAHKRHAELLRRHGRSGISRAHFSRGRGAARQRRCGVDQLFALAFRIRWRRIRSRFVGRAHNRSVRIIGVLPPGYRPPNNGITVQPDLFLPASFESQRMERVQRSMVIIGRLRDGVSVAQARAEIAAITTEVAHETPEGATPPAPW